ERGLRRGVGPLRGGVVGSGHKVGKARFRRLGRLWRSGWRAVAFWVAGGGSLPASLCRPGDCPVAASLARSPLAGGPWQLFHVKHGSLAWARAWVGCYG
ncbi:MAG TPA: hypothetical protein VNF75_03465, partial [Candidatus Dormibacteraeota bacterium]|nr:hypothetical protein [Candidatus Dormibacteraeota bacterium]